jgi:hypothetical protein
MSPFNPHKRNLYIVPEPRRSTRAASRDIGSRGPAPIPRYVRWAIYNSDRKVVGFELLKIGPDLNAYIRKMAEEARQ